MGFKKTTSETRRCYGHSRGMQINGSLTPTTRPSLIWAYKCNARTKLIQKVRSSINAKAFQSRIGNGGVNVLIRKLLGVLFIKGNESKAL